MGEGRAMVELLWSGAGSSMAEEEAIGRPWLGGGVHTHALRAHAHTHLGVPQSTGPRAIPPFTRWYFCLCLELSSSFPTCFHMQQAVTAFKLGLGKAFPCHTGNKSHLLSGEQMRCAFTLLTAAND